MQNGEVDFGRVGDALDAEAEWNLQVGVLRLQRSSSKAGRQLLQDISGSCPLSGGAPWRALSGDFSATVSYNHTTLAQTHRHFGELFLKFRPHL